MKEALQHTIKAFIRKGEKYYVAECLEIPVVTQGKTLDEAAANLREAVALHLEGEDLEQLGLAPNPILIITIEREDLIDIVIARTACKTAGYEVTDHFLAVKKMVAVGSGAYRDGIIWLNLLKLSSIFYLDRIDIDDIALSTI